MPTPDIDVADYLGNTLSELTQNTNLWYGGVLPVDSNVPSLAVFVIPTGGTSPMPLLGSSDPDNTNGASVQILVRGGKDDYPEMITLARTIHDQLKFAQIPGYYNCKPSQSGPIYLGLDSDKHHFASINYELGYED